MEPKRILITGGAGFVGTKLSQKLLALGHHVHVIDLIEPHIQHEQLTYTVLNVSEQPLPEKLHSRFNVVMHLAGRSIFGKWTEEYKRSIFESRINSTRLLAESFLTWETKPETFICASAFGYYGDKGEELVRESTEPGSDFLANVCIAWEREAQRPMELNIRTVQVRTALVLGERGLLQTLKKPFSLGLGGWIGAGKEWFPWVHIDDIVNIYIHAMENTIHGPINTGAPEQVRQKTFMKAVGHALNKPVLFPIPRWAMKLKYGELAETFRNSAKIESTTLNETGFRFSFPTLEAALYDIFGTETK